MVIMGVDYHPSSRTIAFLMEETGECGEQELKHSDGQAEKSRPEAARNQRAGRHGGYRIFTLVRAATRGIRFRAVDRRSRGDQGQASEKAEDRPQRCATPAQTDAGK